MIGYGLSDQPTDLARYSVSALIGDVVATVEQLAGAPAVIVGHDWGAPVAWGAARLRPDLFRAVVGLSVPFSSTRSAHRPTEAFAWRQGDSSERFYMHYFQEPGVAEAELEADPDRTIRAFLYGTGPDHAAPGWSFTTTRNGRLLGDIRLPAEPPPWITDDDIAHVVEGFARNGFTGPLNYYRNLDANWFSDGALEGLPIRIPSLFLVGEHDLVRSFSREAEANLTHSCTDLRGHVVIPGVGHWLQQENPTAVTQALTQFLNGLPSSPR
jgi:pimeloyl-ACP methyl ester carboxylesterase